MSDDPPVEVELYVRSLAACESQPRIETVIAQLETLTADGPITGYSVHVWGDRLGLSETVAATERGGYLRDRIGEFREWAHENGVELAGGFEHATRQSTITGRVQEFLTLPPVALAERRGGELVWITPHRDGDVIHTVREWLDDVASLDADARSGAVTPADD
jgi:hypothetical protein